MIVGADQENSISDIAACKMRTPSKLLVWCCRCCEIRGPVRVRWKMYPYRRVPKGPLKFGGSRVDIAWICLYMQDLYAIKTADMTL